MTFLGTKVVHVLFGLLKNENPIAFVSESFYLEETTCRQFIVGHNLRQRFGLVTSSVSNDQVSLSGFSIMLIFEKRNCNKLMRHDMFVKPLFALLDKIFIIAILLEKNLDINFFVIRLSRLGNRQTPNSLGIKSLHRGVTHCDDIVLKTVFLQSLKLVIPLVLWLTCIKLQLVDRNSFLLLLAVRSGSVEKSKHVIIVFAILNT